MWAMQDGVRRERSLAKSIQRKSALLKLITCQGMKVGGVVDPDLAIQKKHIGNNGRRERKKPIVCSQDLRFYQSRIFAWTKIGAMFAGQRGACETDI